MPRIYLAAFTLLSLAACSTPSASPDAVTSKASVTKVAGYVTDLPSFEQFIATLPTPEQFREQYPDVTLVLPGSITSKELRLNHSRYFATIEARGRISGGRFQ